jgi:starch phosphorylase
LGSPLVGVGLLYRNGFYTQKFAPDGSTRVIYPVLDFAELPIVDTGIVIEVPIGNRMWRRKYGGKALVG